MFIFHISWCCDLYSVLVWFFSTAKWLKFCCWYRQHAVGVSYWSPICCIYSKLPRNFSKIVLTSCNSIPK